MESLVKKNILKMPWLLLLLFIFSVENLSAQVDAKSLLENLEEEDQKSIDALAMYPEDTRIVILQASIYPEALIKLQRMQNKTSADFATLLENYPEQTQREIWDLTRYPKLIHRLMNEVNRNVMSIDNILADYPKVIHTRAKAALKNNYDLLKKVDKLTQTNEVVFESIVTNYDESTQNALRRLVELPEVMTLLTDNIDLTILVGDAYENEPRWVLDKMSELHLKLAEENAKELQDWQTEIENNPEAAKELQASAEDFAKENGYDDLYYDSEDYDYPEDDLYYNADENKTVTVEKHYYYNYPYWYGYPSWYSYPRWRPYPYWYDWGFHYRPGRNIVIVHMPSFYFVDWYFYRPRHHYYYPHLSAHFVHHYYGHRNSVGSVTTSVHRWRQRNREVISEDMVVNAPRRVANFREFGKMEMEREKYNKKNPRTPISQRKFVERNKKSYPVLKREVERQQKMTSKGGDPELSRERAKTKVKDKPVYKPRERVKTEERKVERKKEMPKVKTVPRTQKKREVKKIEKAKDYHRNTWEQNKKQPTRKVEPRVRQKTKTAPKVKTKQPARVKPKKKTKDN